MTNKELRKLKRTELIELLLLQSRELDKQRARRWELEKQLENRRLKLTEAGSIAEAAMEIHHVFSAAQSAADQYLENVRSLQETVEKQCREREAATRRQCAGMLGNTSTRINGMWNKIDNCLTAYEKEHPELSELLRECRDKLAEARSSGGAEANETKKDA